jgi:hypothetical protein
MIHISAIYHSLSSYFLPVNEKLMGKSSLTLITMILFGDSSTTDMSGLNSAKTWRHAPHGGHGAADMPPATAMATGSKWPMETMPATALLSAQIVMPYEEFSTLQPKTTLPSDIKSAAPTLKREYGAYARSAAVRAFFKRVSAGTGQGQRKNSLSVIVGFLLSVS